MKVKRLIFYLWVGLAYLGLGILFEMHRDGQTFLKAVLNQCWQFIYLFALVYFLFEYTMPRISRKRIGRSVWLIIVEIFFASWGLYAWRSIGIGLNIYSPLVVYKTTSHGVADQFGASIGAFFFFAVITHLYDHAKLKQTAQQLRIEKQAAELNYLKSQTNPHFLFNTLNNIYSLARDKSDLAPESIMRLSKILRYMLYETSGEYIAIENELKIMADYIALEELRYDNSLHVNFNHDIEDMRQALPPLLLIPLVENAFKHGVSETRTRPFVDIHLSVNKRQLAFVVKNSTGEVSDGSDVKVNGGLKENIGLSNLRRQLELLYTDFSLSVQQGSSVFTATLKINLASRV